MYIKFYFEIIFWRVEYIIVYVYGIFIKKNEFFIYGYLLLSFYVIFVFVFDKYESELYNNFNKNNLVYYKVVNCSVMWVWFLGVGCCFVVVVCWFLGVVCFV